MSYIVPGKVTVINKVSVYTEEPPTPQKVEAKEVLPIPANSGGVVLSSGDTLSVSIKALVKNSSDIYVGGPDNPPYSGHGFCLCPGEAWNVDVQNLNKVRLVSIISGDKITWGCLKPAPNPWGPSEVTRADVKEVISDSGGVVLSSGEIKAVTIKALAKNSGDIYVGGPDSLPYSGYGYCLEPGEAWNIDVENLNAVYLVAVISGDKVTWGAVE
jgi:hypothetical protein